MSQRRQRMPSDRSTARGDNEPVTVVVTRRVRRGRGAAYEAWLDKLIREASAMKGYLGARVERPGEGEPAVYTSVFRFDSLENLRAFEASELRRRALAEVTDLV